MCHKSIKELKFTINEDLKLSEVITTNKTPLLQRYWKNLQKRDSYKKGILNYYTSKEHKVIKWKTAARLYD